MRSVSVLTLTLIYVLHFFLFSCFWLLYVEWSLSTVSKVGANKVPGRFIPLLLIVAPPAIIAVVVLFCCGRYPNLGVKCFRRAAYSHVYFFRWIAGGHHRRAPADRGRETRARRAH